MSVPKVRNAANTEWIDVFCKGGWKMKTLQGDYITLTAQNTKFRNADNTGWIEFSCPIPVPTKVIGGSIRSNRLVDTNGYVWTAGYGIGVYEDGTNYSKSFQKVKMSSGGAYLSGVRALDAGTNAIAMNYAPTTIFMHDGRVFHAGDNTKAMRGNGTGSANDGPSQPLIDVTSAWKAKIGEISDIAFYEHSGLLLRNDGVPFILGETGSRYLPTSSSGQLSYMLGLAGAGKDLSYTISAYYTTVELRSRWEQLNFTSDQISSSRLSSITQLMKTSMDWVFALRDDGELLQPSLWFRSGTRSSYPGGLPEPTKVVNALRPLITPFTAGIPKNLHQGGFVETESGDLYYPFPQPVFQGDYFYKFEWRALGLNTKVFDSKIVRITGHLQGAGNFSTNNWTYTPTLFVLLEDGRLYGFGDNKDGWFGIGAATTSGNVPVLLNRNVADFDADSQACIVMKKDGTMWATGMNTFYRLGLGDNAPVSTREWMQCVFKSL